MSKTLIIPVGIPGCGKSTLAREKQNEAQDRRENFFVVSSDDIRKSMFKSLVAANDPEQAAANNAKVFAKYHENIERALDGYENVTVVADATNLDSSSRRTLRKIAERTGAQTVAVVFDNMPVAVEQNQMRDEDAIVPDHVMDKMASKLLVALELVQGEGYDWIDWR